MDWDYVRCRRNCVPPFPCDDRGEAPTFSPIYDSPEECCDASGYGFTDECAVLPIGRQLQDACALDVFTCWDGSEVARDPLNNCEFRPCPEEWYMNWDILRCLRNCEPPFPCGDRGEAPTFSPIYHTPEKCCGASGYDYNDECAVLPPRAPPVPSTKVPTSSPTNTPVASSPAEPTLKPTLSCLDEKSLTVDVVTDEFPAKTSWNITDACTGFDMNSIPSETLYSLPLTTYSISWCVPSSAYNFTIFGGAGSYTVTFDGEEVATGGDLGGSLFSAGESESTIFGSCDDTSSPTSRPTPSPTSSPTSTPTGPVSTSFSFLFFQYHDFLSAHLMFAVLTISIASADTVIGTHTTRRTT